MNSQVVAAALVLVCACSDSVALPDAAVVDAPLPLDPLPLPRAVETDQFASFTFCAQCHLRGESEATAMTNATGEDVSPVKLWRGSMMALAARDPFYLAVFEKEIEENPGAREDIEALCTRCHAPAGSIASEREDPKLSFHELTSGSSSNAAIGRDGVTCSFCHQIRNIDLGTDESYTGGFSVGFSRTIYGPHANPDTQPMEFFVRYTPAHSEHVTRSALCATCHTVIVPGAGGREVVEQAPYLEWLNSSFNNESGGAAGITCQGCHMPRTNPDGTAIVTAIAKFPEGLLPRQRYSEHTLVGGNSYMLRLIAGAEDWARSSVPREELLANAVLSEEHLGTAATLEIVSTDRDSGSIRAVVEISNLAGHKLPTGYPTRRAWLHFVARNSAGDVVFESGGYDAEGRIRGAADGEYAPHTDEIEDASQVQVYEQILVDAEGQPTIRALDAHAVEKDNRLLPRGWSATHEQIDRIQPVGVDGDANFQAGGDSISYRFDAQDGSEIVIEVELVYQSVPPRVVDETATFRTAASERFVSLARESDNTPIVIATTSASVAP